MSSEVSDLSGQRLTEKSTYSQTCSLLSQYLKQKGSFGDLSLGMASNVEGKGIPETFHQTANTMNLFPVDEKPARTHGSCKSMDIFPQQAGLKEEVDSGIKKFATAETDGAPMTLFYAGQVTVFDNFPADKAKEIMLLASSGSSKNIDNLASNLAKNQTAFPSHMPKNPIDSSNSTPPTSNGIPNFENKVIQERIQPSSQPIAYDLPIARKASLQRFLEKRKDRVTARAPYQTSIPVEGLLRKNQG